MGIVSSILLKRLRLSATVRKDRHEQLEKSTSLGDELLKAQEQPEENHEGDHMGETGWMPVGNDGQVPPLGAVVTAYLYADNELQGYSYELPSVAELMAEMLRTQPRSGPCESWESDQAGYADQGQSEA